MQSIESLLKRVEKPARYIGGEFNSPENDWKELNYCICFPDLYEVGMSNLGIRIVEESLLTVEGVYVDHAFAPWKDFGDLLRQSGNYLYGLSSKRPLKDFDMIGFSLQYEMSYTTVLYMLDLGGVQLLARDRKEGDPIVQAGGPCCFNPEPMADFFDLFIIGDGENSMAEIAKVKLQSKSREEFLQKASAIQGVYVPKYMSVNTDDNGRVIGFGGKHDIKKAVCDSFDGAVFPHKMTVGNVEAVFDRAVIEVMRGCCRGCRFCQAGYVYRPIRMRKVDDLVSQAVDLIDSTGFDELSLNSLSTGDYPQLKELLKRLKCALPNTSIALPSLRIDSFDGEFIEQSRKSSLTFAPEGGTQRLRDVINKDITEDEIERTVKIAFDKGYTSIKLYFMMGLPTETDEDLNGIADVVYKIRDIYSQNKKAARNLRISVSVSTFIPKPWTAFQWERQISKEEFEHKVQVLKEKLFVKGVSFSWNDFELSQLEAVLARGDRRVGKVIKRAYELGSFLDGWAEMLDKTVWYKALEENGLTPEEYTREFGEDELLAWDFMDIFVEKRYLKSERERAYKGKVTGSCFSGCKGCGMQKEHKCQI
ncbi:MAG: TIGR03960 family B12-binding radical SAM protein [Clostridia bacterium]|nr:TIGR03960 family B12-binding radical SAM protein [Clostridia bacterium]